MYSLVTRSPFPMKLMGDPALDHFSRSSFSVSSFVDVNDEEELSSDLDVVLVGLLPKLQERQMKAKTIKMKTRVRMGPRMLFYFSGVGSSAA